MMADGIQGQRHNSLMGRGLPIGQSLLVADSIVEVADRPTRHRPGPAWESWAKPAQSGKVYCAPLPPHAS